MWMNILTIMGTVASGLGLFVGVLSTDWSIPMKGTVLAFSSVGLFSITFAYFHRIASKRLSGEFEWQWAGNNQIAKVIIKEDEKGHVLSRIRVDRFVGLEDSESGHYSRCMVMESSADGTCRGNKDSFYLNLPVRRLVVDKRIAEPKPITLMEANLRPVEAFAGTVTYHCDNNETFDGDMILVRYSSGIRL